MLLWLKQKYLSTDFSYFFKYFYFVVGSQLNCLISVLKKAYKIGEKTIPATPNNISKANKTIKSSQISESISEPNDLDIIKYSNLWTSINIHNAAIAAGNDTVKAKIKEIELEIRFPIIGSKPHKKVITTNILEYGISHPTMGQTINKNIAINIELKAATFTWAKTTNLRNH